MVDFSIIIPVYCNSETLDELILQIDNKIFKKNEALTGQVVFCDDGSIDDSYEKLININKRFSNTKIIRLTRNFGQISAIICGLENIESKAYIILSADLQDPVSLINKFLSNHFENGFEIVLGERASRDDSYIDQLTAKIFYKIISKLSFPDYPRGGFDYFLISKKIRDLIIRMNQSNPFLQGEIFYTGFQTKRIPYKRKKRLSGKSKTTLSKKITFFIDGILSYSFFPLRAMSFLGFILFLVAILISIVLVIAKFNNYGTYPLGWASSILLTILLNSIQMMFLGIIGEYLWRTLAQVRNKPKYIIDNVIE
tara:strand:- start:7037 stop:7969 length:933 start_codon:yes stop_codon:yes gene_type:complete